MFQLLPQPQSSLLQTAIARGNTTEVQRLLEQFPVDLNAHLEGPDYYTLLLYALTSLGFKSEVERCTLLRFLLEKGANPNLKCAYWYNCLHVGARQDRLAPALQLFLEFGGDVNIRDDNGANVVYWLIQSFPWRTEGAQRRVHLDLLERALLLGADLDQPNRYDVTPRAWLERAPADVQALVARCEALQPVYTPSATQQPEFPNFLQYPEVAKKIWNDHVPPSGESDTVPGEMLRAVEKLRYEAQRNGNVNFGDFHHDWVAYVRVTLVDSGLFDKAVTAQIKAHCKRLLKARSPYTNDDLYDDLTDRVCEWYLQRGAVPREV